MPDDVQPAEGAEPQPSEGAEGGPESYDSLPYDLSEVPPEVREQLEPHLKAIQGNVTKKFQEDAQYRQQWEPFEELGLSQYDPEDIGGLLEFAQLSQDPEQFADWWEAVGEELGLFEESEGDDEEGFTDEEGNTLSADEVQQIVAEGIAPLRDQMTQQEQESRVAAAYNDISNQLAELQQEHKLDDEDLDTILKFAYSYEDDDDPVTRGFEDFQRAIGKGEKGLFGNKANQPPAAEGAGTADTSPEPITSMDEAKAMAKERLKQSLAG